MKLIYAPQSPYARKVRAAAVELGLADGIELVYAETVPGKPNPAYAQVNPLRKVPALVLDDGTALFDSTVICDYLDARAGGGRLVPAAGAARWTVLTEHAAAQGLCDAVILIRYETWLRPEALRWQAWLDDQWDKIWSGLAWFEARAAGLERPVDIAQLALGSMLGYVDFRWGTPWRERFPHLAAWFARLSERPCFKLTMPAPPPGT